MNLFGPFSPDLPGYRSRGLVRARNVIPRTDLSYGPLPALSAFSPALPARCHGIVAAKTSQGIVRVFAGTATGLYELALTRVDEPFSDGTWFTDGTGWVDSASPSSPTWAWTDISRSGGYGLGDTDRWRFVQFGNLLIAIPGINETIQSINLETGTAFADLSGNPPKARYGAVVGDFLMLGHTSDSSGVHPTRVHWSGINNPESWPAIGSSSAASVQSDAQDLPDGGDVRGIVPAVGGHSAAIFGASRIWRASFSGPPTYFQFREAERSRGVAIDGSIVGYGRVAFFWSDDGIYMFDGTSSRPIGAEIVDRFALQGRSSGYDHRMSAVLDQNRHLVVWSYVSVDATGTDPDRLLIYNWQTNRWSYADMTAEIFGSSASPAYTLEDLDLFGDLDSLPFSLDDPSLFGGNPVLVAVDTSHVPSTLSGANLEADLETVDLPVNGAARSFIRGVRIYTDAPSATAKVMARDRLSDTHRETPLRSVGADYMVPARLDGRFVRINVRIPQGTDWDHVEGFDLDIRRSGRR